MDTPDDPYFAGRVAFEAGPPSEFLRSRWLLVLAWITVFALNLIVPLEYGWERTKVAGKYGMFAAILLMLAMGCRASFVSRKVGMALVVGGGIMAAFQMIPFLQMIAGMIGISVAGDMGQVTNPKLPLSSNVNSELGGFVATSLTGGLLIVAAGLIGMTLVSLASLIRRSPSSKIKGRPPLA